MPSPFKSNIRSCWGQKEALGLFVLTVSPVGPCPPSPSTGEEKRWVEHACASSEVTWRPGTNMVSIGPWGDRGTQSLLPSPLLREKATEESGPAPKAHPFRVYRLPVLRRLSQKQLLLVSVSTSVSTCGAMNQHPFCQLPPGVTSPRPEESANKKPQQTTIPLAWGAHVLRPWAGRDVSVRSLWFGCTPGAWVHHTAGSPSSAGQTGIPGTQTALQSS